MAKRELSSTLKNLKAMSMMGLYDTTYWLSWLTRHSPSPQPVVSHHGHQSFVVTCLIKIDIGHCYLFPQMLIHKTLTSRMVVNNYDFLNGIEDYVHRIRITRRQGIGIVWVLL
ncbi:uncharacterized protein LOC111897139 [Lactuca sativa]|uniref:uncharacterized protein LOC111897139 n=1 Tax=Lactuca sativa TaxID=4236 RepID=UPI000CD9DD54|nr:uncharacterized protein LOC111897139 [Lactuca sativa]